MTEEFQFTPPPRIAAKKRKRSQTAPLIASIATPAVVMIAFLVYLDHKGFFGPPAPPKNVQAKAPAQQPHAIANRVKPLPVARNLKAPAPKQPSNIGGGAGAFQPVRRAPVLEPAQIVEPPPPKDAEIDDDAEPQDDVTGNNLPSVWEIEFPSRAIIRSRHLHVAKNQIADPLAANPSVWVFVDRGAPAACFPLGSRKARSVGLTEPVFHGTALAIGDTRMPAMAVQYKRHKRTGWLRTFNKDGDTDALLFFVNGERRGLACVCDKGQLAYIEEIEDIGKEPSAYFVAVDGERVNHVPVDRADPKQVERAAEFKQRLSMIVDDINVREQEWRRFFTTWDTRCTNEITAAAFLGNGEEKISQLKGEQDRLRKSLLGGG